MIYQASTPPRKRGTFTGRGGGNSIIGGTLSSRVGGGVGWIQTFQRPLRSVIPGGVAGVGRCWSRFSSSLDSSLSPSFYEYVLICVICGQRLDSGSAGIDAGRLDQAITGAIPAWPGYESPHPGCPSSPQPPGQPALEAPDIVWAAYGHPSPRTAAEATAFRLSPWGQKIRTRL